MKKLLKVGSSVLAAGMVLLTSGCGCSLKEEKVIERSTSLKGTELGYVEDNPKDYVATYKVVHTDGDVKTVTTYTIKRDIEGDIYYFTKVTGAGPASKIIEYETVEEKLYKENGIVKYETPTGVLSLPQFISPAAAFPHLKDMVEGTKTHYYGYSWGAYDLYKQVPYNACTPEGFGNPSSLPDILDSYIESSLDCKTTRELFGKKTTYEVQYRVSISELTKITVKSDKNNIITSVTQVNNRVSSNNNEATQEVESITYTLSYEDVK